ncbi:MAG: sugar phosphate isomerase/epimerase family protein [Nanoarchaeota archaeon]|nr:sugar phosphate isomerase/epimerase family protein [Nanoarchaeota archaeon]
MKKGIFVKLSGYGEDSWSSEFEFAKKLDCDCVEFVLDYPLLGPSTYDEKTLERIKGMAGDLEIIVHLMPHRYLTPNKYDQVPELKGKTFDLASLDSQVRRFSIQEVEKSFVMAKQLGARIVTIHGGFCRNQNQYQKNLDALRTSLEELNKYANGVKLCLENMPVMDHFGNKVEEIPKSPEDLNLLTENLENVGITLDTGHANTIMQPERFFDKLKKVWNIHVHDNGGDRDNHLILGEGNIDFVYLIELLKERNYEGYFNLELDINWDESKVKVSPSREQRGASWKYIQGLL